MTSLTGKRDQAAEAIVTAGFKWAPLSEPVR